MNQSSFHVLSCRELLVWIVSTCIVPSCSLLFGSDPLRCLGKFVGVLLGKEKKGLVCSENSLSRHSL